MSVNKKSSLNANEFVRVKINWGRHWGTASVWSNTRAVELTNEGWRLRPNVTPVQAIRPISAALLYLPVQHYSRMMNVDDKRPYKTAYRDTKVISLLSTSKQLRAKVSEKSVFWYISQFCSDLKTTVPLNSAIFIYVRYLFIHSFIYFAIGK